MNFAHCLHIVLVIGKYTDIFRKNYFMVGGLEEGVTRENLSMEYVSLGYGTFL